MDFRVQYADLDEPQTLLLIKTSASLPPIQELWHKLSLLQRSNKVLRQSLSPKLIFIVLPLLTIHYIELQQQYTNYKNSLQQLAQKIGDVEADTEEHKYVSNTPPASA